MESVKTRITELFTQKPKAYTQSDKAIFESFLNLLEKGEIRAAEQDHLGNWHVNHWVKEGILVGFRMGKIIEMSNGKMPFFDKDTFPVQTMQAVARSIRIVPGGSSVRRGAFVGHTVTCMPPMYINVGAYIGEGTMIDSHALVGSCAQIGSHVHLSAAAQIGGVLEPIGAMPVIIEDNVLVGGNTGIYEGTIVKKGAVIGSGVILTSGTPVYDVVNETIYRRVGDNPLIIPENAVVVQGSRPMKSDWAIDNSLSIYTPIIIKYRDEKTDAATALEDALR